MTLTSMLRANIDCIFEIAVCQLFLFQKVTAVDCFLSPAYHCISSLMNSLFSPRRVKTATPPPTSSGEEARGDVGAVWKRVTLVLELIGQTCPHIADVHTVMPLLFAILGR